MAQILPFTSLDAASAVGPGASVDLNGVSNEFTVVSFSTGSPTSVNVQLQGSHDNVNWFSYENSISAPATPAAVSTEFQLIAAGGSSPMYSKPFARYVRANLESLSGGTSPTVTATIAVGRVI